MCIAIYHDAKCFLTEEEFFYSWKNNPDGGGFMYFDEANEIVIERSMDFDEMRSKYYAAIEKYSETSPFAVHFRIATHGSVNLSNCHPFRSSANTALMHNGIIPVLMEKKDKRSDTRVFAEEYMPRLPKGWMDDDYLFTMVEEFIGASKVIVFTNDPKLDSYMYILNEKDGHWNQTKTKWYSNKSYCSFSKAVGPDIKTYGIGSWSEPTLAASNSPLDECRFCNVPAILDGMCYACETCNDCMMNESSCMCHKSLNDLTEDQWTEYVKGLM